MNKSPGRLFYVILSGMILTVLIICSVPVASASQGARPTIVPAMPSEEPPPTDTPTPTSSPTVSPLYFSTPGGPTCVGGGCTLPSGYNVIASPVLNNQSLQAYDPKAGSVFGTGRVETTIKVIGAGIGTVRVYYGLSGVNCTAGHSLDITKASGNVNHPNVPLSGYLDVPLTASDRGAFNIFTRCFTSGSYVGNFGISSVWYSLIEVATPTVTPTSTPSLTPTSMLTNTPTITPTPNRSGSGTCWASGASWPYYDVTYSIDSSIPTSWVSYVETSAYRWTSVSPSHFTFSRSQGSDNFIDKGPVAKPAEWVAITNVYATTTTPITLVTTTFDENDSFDPNFPPAANSYSVENIMVHEFGHWLYLKDIYDSVCSDVTMYGYSDYGQTSQITLEDPDKEAINWQYP